MEQICLRLVLKGSFFFFTTHEQQRLSRMAAPSASLRTIAQQRRHRSHFLGNRSSPRERLWLVAMMLSSRLRLVRMFDSTRQRLASGLPSIFSQAMCVLGLHFDGDKTSSVAKHNRWLWWPIRRISYSTRLCRS